jgi:hypothetical protein
LNVARKQHAPTAIGHPHDIVMAGVDVESLRGQRPRADVKHDRQTLTGDHVEHFFHQDQPLS